MSVNSSLTCSSACKFASLSDMDSFRREQWIHSGHDQLTVESHQISTEMQERVSVCMIDKMASSCYHYQTRPVTMELLGDRTCPGSILPSHSATVCS